MLSAPYEYFYTYVLHLFCSLSIISQWPVFDEPIKFIQRDSLIILATVLVLLPIVLANSLRVICLFAL